MENRKEGERYGEHERAGKEIGDGERKLERGRHREKERRIKKESVREKMREEGES